MLQKLYSINGLKYEKTDDSMYLSIILIILIYFLYLKYYQIVFFVIKLLYYNKLVKIHIYINIIIFIIFF